MNPSKQNNRSKSMNAKMIAAIRLRRRSYFAVFAGLALSTAPWSDLLAQNGSTQVVNDDGIVHWPRLDFVIPFNVDTTGQTPREIQLEYSEDAGRSWALYSSGDVRTKQFHFKAKADGEYRFRLKTLDNQGRTFDNPGEPLRVFVDTTKPEAKLLVDIDPKGVMQAEFEIVDSAIDVSTIQLTYQTEGLSQWREISVELRPSENPSALIGAGSWSIPSGTRQLVVRLTAKDKAGNPIEVTRLPQLPRSAAVQGNLQLASGKPRDLSATSSRSNSQPTHSQPIGSGVVDSFPDALPKVEVLGRPKAKVMTDAGIANQLAEQQQKIEQLSLQSNRMAQQRSQAVAAAPALQNPSDRVSLSDRVSVVDQRNVSPFPNHGGNTNRLPVRELSDEELEQLQSQSPVSLVAKRSDPIAVGKGDSERQGVANNSLQIEPKVTRIPNHNSPQKDIKPLYGNSKAFSLDYTIDNEPDSPVSSVELWGTADEGQSWHMWGQDPDRESPFDIEVETEGLFGFRMVIVGANGLASNRPRNGDNADTWIHVDVQEPQARIISALYGKGKESGSMIVEYQASDDHFPERPITLSYSPAPTGPWTQIATGVRNNGRFVWPADPSLPSSIFLRVEAHDAAGNVTVSQLDHPVDVEGLAPRGRIQGFRPIK